MTAVAIFLWAVVVFAWQAWSMPDLPLSTSGRWMLDKSGKKFTYAGINWPGHMAAMIPEGIQYQSIPQIVTKLKSLGMNSVRLTYATEMVDDIIDKGGDVSLEKSLTKALGAKNGSEVLKSILKNNGEILKATSTRLQVGQSCVTFR